MAVRTKSGEDSSGVPKFPVSKYLVHLMVFALPVGFICFIQNVETEWFTWRVGTSTRPNSLRLAHSPHNHFIPYKEIIDRERPHHSPTTRTPSCLDLIPPGSF